MKIYAFEIYLGENSAMNSRIISKIALASFCAGVFVFAMAITAYAASDAAATRSFKAPADAIWLDSLDLNAMASGGGSPKAGNSVYGLPMMLGGAVYRHGVGTHADSFMVIDLKGQATKFVSMVGINDELKGKGSVIFEVWTDSKKTASSGVMHGGDKPQLMSVDLTGKKTMFLIVDSAGDGSADDSADWAGALIYLAPGAKDKPIAITSNGPLEPAPPIANDDSPMPKIHGARVTGGTPGYDFLFLIPATGEAPLSFFAKNLPDGLKLDEKTGIISGKLAKEGKTVVELTASNKLGSAHRKLTIIAGDHVLAQTPPMGWNSWNVWGLSVDEQKVKDAADAMVNSGLAAHGFQFVNIDDGWEAAERAADGEIVTNDKFKDMKRLSDYVHSRGLKLGIYSSPGPRTCGGYLGTWQHEDQDAATWAKWGIDYIKYDWCSYGGISKGNSLEELMKPYQVMRGSLDKSGRDIVYSLCQYGMGAVWDWGEKVGGNLWRTTGDINDSWGSLSGIGFSQADIGKNTKPGHWNDPDMLVVGKVGWGPTIHATKLSQNEQIMHITMWSMLAAPLLIGCDMTQLDDFTHRLLTNDEVLDVNQDPLGIQANRKSREAFVEVWARPLWDGTIAVALFNRYFERMDVTAKWSDLGISGKQPVRDLWLQKDLGSFDGAFTASVPAHGAIMLKIGTPKESD